RLSFYEAVGGHETFARLVDRFYEGVADDPELRPMYPEEDLTGAKHRLCTFLEQYWGGPKTYGAERGHPRLRMRHAVFPVSPSARDAWLRHMRTALDSLELAPLHEQTLWDYLDRAAQPLGAEGLEPRAGPLLQPRRRPGPRVDLHHHGAGAGVGRGALGVVAGEHQVVHAQARPTGPREPQPHHHPVATVPERSRVL